MIDVFMSTKNAAAFLNRSVSWMAKNRHLIPTLQIGTGKHQYRLADLEAFIANNIRGGN